MRYTRQISVLLFSGGKLQLELWGFHPAPHHGHVDPQGFYKPLPGAADIGFRGRLRDGAGLEALEPQSHANIFPVQKDDYKAGHNKPEQLPVGIALAGITGENRLMAHPGKQVLRLGFFQLQMG